MPNNGTVPPMLANIWVLNPLSPNLYMSTKFLAQLIKVKNLTVGVKGQAIVPDVVILIANQPLIVLLETQNATNAKKLAILPMFVLQKAGLKRSKKGRRKEVEVAHRHQVLSEADVLESQVQPPKIAINKVGCDPKNIPQSRVVT